MRKKQSYFFNASTPKSVHCLLFFDW